MSRNPTKQNMAFLLAQQDAAVISGNTSYTSDVTMVGNLAVGDYFDVTAASGDIAVNTNKFTVAGSSGNTVIAGTASVAGALSASAAVTVGTTLEVTGDVAVNTDKFTVAASSGNTSIAGALNVKGNTTIAGVLRLTSDAVNLTATGSTEADALLLNEGKAVHIITAGVTNTGVKLPAATASGRLLFIKNFTNSAKKLYVTGVDVINDNLDNSGLVIAANVGIIVCDVTTSAWVSF